MSSQEQTVEEFLCLVLSWLHPAAYGLFINIVAKAFFVHFSMPLGRRSFAKVIPAAVPGVIPGQRQTDSKE